MIQRLAVDLSVVNGKSLMRLSETTNEQISDDQDDIIDYTCNGLEAGQSVIRWFESLGDTPDAREVGQAQSIPKHLELIFDIL